MLKAGRWLWIPMALAGVAPSGLVAQQRPLMLDSLAAIRPSVTIPFAPREHLRYKVKAGIFSVGQADMMIGPIDSIHGLPTYPAEWHIRGGVPFYKMDTRLMTWMDVETLISRRFVKDQHEGGRKRYREYEFFPDRMEWQRIDHDTIGSLPSSMPLDDVSLVYYARTLPLEVGETYSLNRYFKGEGNPVILQVLRKDRRKVGAGEFNTIVVRPIIRTRGIFSQGGEAEIHFSDDDRRLVVYMKTKIPGASLTLHLEEILDGGSVQTENQPESGSPGSVP